MKRYNIFMGVVLAAFIIVAAVIDIAIYNSNNQASGKPYNIEINRIMAQLEQGATIEQIDMANYRHINRISFLPQTATASEQTSFFNDETALVRLLNNNSATNNTATCGYVRFTYTDNSAELIQNNLILINAAMLVLLVFLCIVLTYLRQQVIKPFETFSSLPAKLAQGRLDEPLQEQKSRFFGRFLWGLDNLRESLLQQRAQSLQLEKDRKTLSLALSHDIKTPLAAVQLYATALRDGLYAEPQKQQESLNNIISKTHEIEDYLNQMVRSSSEDFLALEVQNGEFYLDDLLANLQNSYAEKLELLGVALELSAHNNAILFGDQSRALEAIENVIENALKYGDGKPINLHFSVEEGAQLISIANSGNSLPAQEVAHIFESFWRGSNAQTQSGNGLGLFIVRQIMHQMQGDVYATVNGEIIKITLVFKLQ
jgi:signal transduction histidine kinase